MRLKNLVRMLTAVAVLTSSCSSTPPPKPEAEPAYQDSRLTTWDDECGKDDDPQWTRCPKKTLSWVYHLAVDLAHDLETEKVLRGTADQRWQLKVDERDAKLDQWFRKWYITLPLGILAGAAVGFGVGFGIKAFPPIHPLFPGVTLQSVMGAGR